MSLKRAVTRGLEERTAQKKTKPASAGPEPVQATAAKPGPTSLKDAFAWADDMGASVSADPDRLRRLKQMLQKNWCVSSDYSGLRTEEVCFGALHNALLQSELGCGLKHWFLYSCDCDPLCQSTVLGTKQSRQPQHCFKDLNGWLTPAAADFLDM